MSILLNNEQDEIDAMIHPKAHPYHEMFLDDMDNLHKDLFERFIVEFSNKDFFSLVDTYLLTSDIRYYIDIGARYGLERSSKGCIESINIDMCYDNDEAMKLDINIAKWMGVIYNYMQWQYNISSKEICKCIPARKLYNLYESLKEKNKEEIVGYLYQTYVLR